MCNTVNLLRGSWYLAKCFPNGLNLEKEALGDNVNVCRYQLRLQFCLLLVFLTKALICFYTATGTEVNTTKSTWQFSELGSRVNTEKTCKRSKCMWVVEGSLKPQISLLKIPSAWTMVDHLLACMLLHLWKSFLKLLTRLEGNKYRSKKVEWKCPSTKMLSRNLLCLWNLPEGFYRKFKETNLLKALHVFASGSGNGVHC